MSKINKTIMTIAGLLLIVGSALKCHQLIATCVPSWQDNPTGFWESYEFFLIQIPLEFALGVWMVCGLFRKAAWIAGALAYFGFIFVTIFKVVTGAESCGCFGQITVDPKITLFAIDIPFFLLLAIFGPKGTKLLPPPWPNLFYLLLVFVPTIALMVAAPAAMVALRPDCIKPGDDQPDATAPLKLEIYQLKQDLTAQQQEIDTLKQTILELQHGPAEPVENGTAAQQPTEIEPPVVDTNDMPPAVVEQWDWLQYVVEDDVREQISEGLVVIMMNRYDCPVCEEMAPRYSEYYAQMVENKDVLFKIAFLSIPPYGDVDHVPDDTTCIVGKLTDERKWELMSPYVVALLDGELVKQWEQGTAPEAENILDEVFGQ